MAATAKRHLYCDQRPTGDPADEPIEAEHAPVSQRMFARREPTTEDDFFFEEERKTAHGPKLPIEAKEIPRLKRPAQPPAAQAPISERRPGILEKLVRALTRRADTSWRP